MSIDKLLLDKTTIKFPRPLNLKESEKLLKYIAEKLPGEVNCNVNYYKHIIYDGDKNKLAKINGTLKISANVVSFKDVRSFWDMSMIPSDKDSSKLSSIEFSKIPGWDIDDYRPGVQKLWDNMREIVDDYFKEREFLRI